MTGRVFVDETKQHGYLLVGAVVAAQDLASTRKLLRTLILPGQRRLHMKDERDSRKREILSALCSTDLRATVYDAGRRHGNERGRREACLRALVGDAAAAGHTLLVVEQDDSLVSWDNQRLIELTRAAGCQDTLRYRHEHAHADELLAIPDAIAWCWAKGGDWRRRVEAIVSAVRSV